jgi:DNA repair protein RadC
MSGQFGFGTSGSSPGPFRPRNYRVCEVRFSVVRESASDLRDLSNPSAVNSLVRGLGDTMIPDDAREHFSVLMLNAENRLVAQREAHSGARPARPPCSRRGS